MRGYEVAATHDGDVVALVGVGGGERRAAPYLGVKALMLAILEEALRTYLGPPGAEHDAAVQWITDKRSRWVFSFAVVCESLGLEPGAVRVAMRRMHATSAVRPLFVLGRSRPNGRRHPGLRTDTAFGARRSVGAGAGGGAS